MSENIPMHPHELGSMPITELNHACDLHRAAAAIRLLRNRQQDLAKTGVSQATINARVQILDVATDLMLSERNRILDKFSQAWLAFRKESADGP